VVLPTKRGEVGSSDRERNDGGNGAPYGAGEPTHAPGPSGESDRWLRSVLEHSSEIVTMVDPDGTLRYANPAWQRVLGYDPDEAIGTMNVLDHVHPEDLAHVLEETEEALSEGGVVTNEAEYRFRHKDGSWRWVESLGTYLLDDPAVGGVVVVSRDVTERKEREEALRRSEAEIFSVLESITDGFFALDHELRFTYVNPQAEVMLNRSGEDLIGERIWEDPTFYPKYRRAMAEGKTVRFEGYYPALKVWYDVRAYPSQSGLSVYFQDVTERRDAEERVRFQSRLLDAVGESVIALDLEGRVLYWNRAAEEMYGWTSEEAMGRRLTKMVVSEDLQGLAEEIMAEVREGRAWTGQLEVRRRDGTTFAVEGTDTPVFGEDGGLVCVIGVLRDITERKKAEERLREAEERYRTLVERVPAVTYVQQATAPGAVTYVSPQMKELLGYEPEECTSDQGHWLKVIHPEDLERVLEEDRRVNETGEPFSIEYRQFAKDGRIVWIRDEATLVRDGQGKASYWLGVQTDVTERKILEDRLRHQAFHDALTDLPNRQLFMDRLGHALARTQRRQGRRVAVLFMDLNDFKSINDSLGHEAGDLLLVAVAERLKECLRPEDTLARFGGDEFVVLLEDVDGPEEAVRVAGRITEALREPFVMEDRELYVSASIGIALGQNRTESPEDLLRKADTAMYEAKPEAAPGYRVFDPVMHERVMGRLELENDLRRAMGAGEFVIHYQPIFDLGAGEVWGLEALLRWNHSEKGLLGPSEFVPVAEETGLIVPMGAWVLEEACRRTKEWQDRHDRNAPLAVIVNLSPKQLLHPGCEETIREALAKSGLGSRALGLDVTESVFVGTREDSARALERIQALGVRIFIDDFGMGYSSLSYLKRLPADALKIDKAFVRGLGEDPEDTAIVRMMIDVAHTLGLEVVAEGVETWAQAALLAETGCDMAQGYHFAKPLPPDAVPGFLAD